MLCIFCSKEVSQSSIEHIVPESLGNHSYILEIGAICRSCNNRFSKFEDKALGKTMLAFERTRLGIPTKKRNPAKASSKGIRFEGHAGFQKNLVTVFGLSEDNIESINDDGSINIQIQDFDKSEMATSKLLLKIGLEAIYQSRKKIYKIYDFSQLKDHLTNKDNIDWPFLTMKILPSNFNSIVRFRDKLELKKIPCELKFSLINDSTLLFNFRYSILSYVINLVNRDLSWTEELLCIDNLANLYPEYLKDNSNSWQHSV